MRMQVNLCRRLQSLFQLGNEIVRRIRQKQVCHIFDTDIVRSHAFQLLRKLHEIIGRMHGARCIADRRLTDTAVFFDRLHRRFKVARIVERVENAHHFDPVFYGFCHKFFNHVVGIMSVSQKILPAQKHLDRRFLQIFSERAEPFPRVFVQIAKTSVKGSAAPRLQGIITDLVELLQNGDHVFDRHARSSLRLMRVTQDRICNKNFFNALFCHFRSLHKFLYKSTPRIPPSRRNTRQKAKLYQPPKNASRKPAATADPITPATFGPIACISK